MANPTIGYAYFVEDVSRKFTLRKNKCSQNNAYGVYTATPAKYMGGAQRKDRRFGYGIAKKNYMFLRFNPRSTAVTAEERQQRTNFGVAAKLRAAWNQDLAVVTQMLSAWQNPTNGTASGVAKLGYTFKGWLFAVAYAVVNDGGSETSPWPGYVPAQ